MARLPWGLGALASLLAATVAGAQPANDDCANATVIGSLPFTDEVDTSLATNEGGEPSSACSGGANVWYVLPPAGSDRNVYVDVFRSDSTEANATIYPGTCGAFGAALGQCATGDDNAAATIPAGTTAYVEVLGHGGTARVTIDEMPEFLVTADGDQYQFQGVGGSPDGRFLVAWTSNSTFDVRARVYDGPDSPVAAEMAVSPSYGSAPDADGLAPSGFVVTWGSGALRLLDDTGAPVGGAFAVETGGQEPRVAADGSGNFVVAWRSSGPSFQLFDSSGTAIAPHVDLPATTDEPVDVGMDAAGNFVVGWWNAGTVYAQRFDAAGGSLAAPLVVNESTYPPDYTHGDVAVAMSAAGDFVVAWDEAEDAYTPAEVEVARARVFDANGVAKGGSFVITESPTPYYIKHRLRADDDGTGDFIVVWEDDGGRAGAFNLDMRGRRVSRTGAVGGPQFDVATATYRDQYDPNVAGGPNGEFMVAWSSYRANEPWGSDYAVPARLFGAGEARFDSACADAPLAGCLTPVVAGASSLSIRDEADDSRDRLKWKLAKGDATSAEDFGNPAQAHPLGVCLYDAADALVFHGRILPGGDCGTKPCWRPLGKPPGSKGYKLARKDGTPDGIQKVVLKPGVAGKTKILVKGGKEGLSGSPTGFSPLPLALPARIQLQQPRGPCWEATFDSAGIQSATATTLRAKSAAP